MPTQAAQRYVRRFIPITVIYCLLIGANTFATHQLSPAPLMAGVLAVVVSLPIIAMIVVMGMYLREETDEFVRDRHIFAMMIATGLLLAVASLLGMLQFARVLGEVKVFLAFPLWCATWGLTQWVLCRRDRHAEEAA